MEKTLQQSEQRINTPPVDKKANNKEQRANNNMSTDSAPISKNVNNKHNLRKTKRVDYRKMHDPGAAFAFSNLHLMFFQTNFYLLHLPSHFA